MDSEQKVWDIYDIGVSKLFCSPKCILIFAIAGKIWVDSLPLSNCFGLLWVCKLIQRLLNHKQSLWVVLADVHIWTISLLPQYSTHNIRNVSLSHWAIICMRHIFSDSRRGPHIWLLMPESCHSRACVKALSRLYRWRGVWLDEMMLLQCVWQWKSFWTYRTHQCIFSSQLLGFSARYHVVSLYLKIKIENDE